ncbi:MAG: LD-carboxypeptidase [Deltaproteobacteria bacterium]|nr:LD-carboxypeptidase [Deltaproteobacteria bacterium]
MQKPKALKPGDTIGIAASASPFDRDEFQHGIAHLEKMGFKIYHRGDIFEKKSYLAGSDARRTDELLELLKNPEIKGVFFARGGYGLMRILSALDSEKLKIPPKIVLGYSDITALLAYLYQKYGWTTFYGPVVAKDLSANGHEMNLKYLEDAVTSTSPLGPFTFDEITSNEKGTAEGILVGGCLSLVRSLLATPFELILDNKIVFLEDINEKPYSVDRMLTQLVLAGRLKKVKGIIFGNFVNGGEAAHFQETALDVLKDFKGPILFNFPAGHGPLKVTLPLGIKVRVCAVQKKLEYLESACI